MLEQSVVDVDVVLHDNARLLYTASKTAFQGVAHRFFVCCHGLALGLFYVARVCGKWLATNGTRFTGTPGLVNISDLRIAPTSYIVGMPL